MTISIIEYVKHYRDMGWVPIPVHDVFVGHCSCVNGQACKSGGKHPRVTQDAALAADLNDWGSWARRWRNMNLAVLTGSKYGFFVVDIDPRHAGDINFAKFCEEHGLAPVTLQAKSGGGGLHYFFKAGPFEAVKSDVNVLGQGVDIRGEGGIILVEPSATTGEYKWL
jgi:hypothetical protein